MHKERYFTPETIAAESRRMLRAVWDSGLGREPALLTGRAALLVLDMQDYFLDESSHAWIPSAGAILPRLQTLIRAFADSKSPVIFTRHLNTPQDAGMMVRWWRDLISPGDGLSRITGNLDVAKGRVLEKSRYDAFLGTGLEDDLRALGVAQVVTGGVMTHLCVETTARSAFGRGFDVLFPVDATATYNRAFHEASLLNLAHGFAVPVLADEILEIG